MAERRRRAGAGPRIMIASHGHPELSKGGAENAAFHLFEGLRGRGIEAWFLGCGRPAGQGGELTITQPFSEREFLYAPGSFNWFNFANRDPRLPRELTGLLTELKPDIVHLHHYAVLGVEAFEIVRRTLPAARIVLTLHEFLAICHHFGQMVTRPELHLCRRATDQRCAACFPDIAPSDFFLRRRYVQSFFERVDQFVAPSAFLAERYVQWGVPSERMAVLDNVLPVSSRPAGPRRRGEALLVGFFGQISKLKGIDVLLGAAEALAEEGCHAVQFAVFGDASAQPEVFRAEVEARLKAAGSNVSFYGAYEQIEVDALMAGVDAVLVPSIWWENSPLVIEEAMRARRPVICSDIGGMAEKVRDGIDGFHFRAGSALALAALLNRLAAEPSLLKGVSATLRDPAPPERTLDAHLALYRRLLTD